jgi:excisionase family DNA binding protein
MAARLDAARDRLQAEIPAPAYMTVEEAAGLARCNPATIRREVHRGHLRAFRPARRVLLREDDVREWIESRAAAPGDEIAPRAASPRRAAPGSVQAIRRLEQEHR